MRTAPKLGSRGRAGRSDHYYKHRDNVLRAKIKEGKTRCPYCGKEMNFRGLESFDQFAHRHMAQHGGWPSLCRRRDEMRKATIDHLFPKSRGGGDAFRNMTIMCGGCNADKADQTPPEWIAKRELLGRPLSDEAKAHLMKRWRKAARLYRKRPTQ